MSGIHDIRKSLEGNILGLDGTEDTTGLYQPHLVGKDFRGAKTFPIGSSFKPGMDYKGSHTPTPFYNDYFDDFLGPVLSTARWNANKGSDGTAAIALNIQSGGVLRLTSGAGGTHTMAVNGSQLTSALNFKVSNGGLRMETRLGKIAALTSQSICIGLADVSTLSAPFTLATATVTANGTNGVAFLQDSAGTNTHLSAVAVNAGATPQVVALTADVDTAALHVYRIEVDKLGNALFYIDGTQVASILLAVATTSVLCTSVGMFSNATSASQTLDTDYVLAQQVRV